MALSCLVIATPSAVRHEGIADLMGDIVLAFTGGTGTEGGARAVTVDIYLTLNVNIPNRRRKGTTAIDAFVVPDDPTSSPRTVGVPIHGRLLSINSLLFASRSRHHSGYAVHGQILQHTS